MDTVWTITASDGEYCLTRAVASTASIARRRLDQWCERNGIAIDRWTTANDGSACGTGYRETGDGRSLPVVVAYGPMPLDGDLF